MKLLRIIISPFFLIYKLWIGLWFWLTLLLLYPFFRVLLSREEWFPAVFRLKRFWSKLLQVLFFCPVKSHFKAELPEPPYIICSNHSSYLDTVFFYSVFSDYFLFIGKGELLKWPLFRLFFRRMDIPVMRENFRHAYGALQKAYDAIDEGSCVAIYPEGTIPLDAPRMQAFKKGAFKMAIDKQVPIVPITWQQNYKIMGEPTRLFSRSHPALVKVVVHEPIETKGLAEKDLNDLRKRVFDTINSALPEEFQKTPRK